MMVTFYPIAKPLNPPSSPFFKGGKKESFIELKRKALLPLKKGGREGFLVRLRRIKTLNLYG